MHNDQEVVRYCGYYVWCPADGNRPESPNVRDFYPESAADKDSVDNPLEITVIVEDGDGHGCKYVVRAEMRSYLQADLVDDDD